MQSPCAFFFFFFLLLFFFATNTVIIIMRYLVMGDSRYDLLRVFLRIAIVIRAWKTDGDLALGKIAVYFKDSV